MGILGIIFGTKRVVINPKTTGIGGALGQLQGVLRQTIGGVAGIVVDATVSEEHLSSVEVTENPVEDGARVTDHVQIRPVQLTVQGVISDTPLGYAVIGNIQNIVRTVQTLWNGDSRSISAYNDLLNLQRSRTPFSVVTGLRKYENMVMTELSVPRTAETGRAIHFRAVMREMRIVSSKTAPGLVNASPAARSLAAPVKDNGNNKTDLVPAPVGQTVLYDWVINPLIKLGKALQSPF